MKLHSDSYYSAKTTILSTGLKYFYSGDNIKRWALHVTRVWDSRGKKQDFDGETLGKETT
jgi:hypothetical protein